MKKDTEFTLSTNSDGNLVINSTMIDKKTLEDCGCGYETESDGRVSLTISSNGICCKVNPKFTFYKQMCSDLLEMQEYNSEKEHIPA